MEEGTKGGKEEGREGQREEARKVGRDKGTKEGKKRKSRGREKGRWMVSQTFLSFSWLKYLSFRPFTDQICDLLACSLSNVDAKLETDDKGETATSYWGYNSKTKRNKPKRNFYRIISKDTYRKKGSNIIMDFGYLYFHQIRKIRLFPSPLRLWNLQYDSTARALQ